MMHYFVRMYRLAAALKWAAVVCAVVFTAEPLIAQVACPYDGQSFTIYQTDVALPSDYFLLVRHANQFGAIRITRVMKDTKTQPKVGEWIGTISYESSFAGKTGSFSEPSSVNHEGQATFGKMVGWSFHTSHQLGNHIALVGSWKFNFSPECLVSMSAWNFWKGPLPGFEVAATSASNLSELDPTDPRLHWYKPNPNREGIDIRTSTLPHRGSASHQELK